jgi:hypothetical protein
MTNVRKVSFSVVKTGSFFEEAHCCNVKPFVSSKFCQFKIRQCYKKNEKRMFGKLFILEQKTVNG